MMNRYLGQALARVDGRVKVTGQAMYSSDFSLPGMVHARLIRSTIARGRIKDMDTAAAEAAPGVLAVITPRNAPRLKPLSFPQPGQPPGYAGKDFLPLQDNEIRFYGQVIGMVIAETPEQAAHAAGRVTVSYDLQIHRVDMNAALDELYKPASGVEVDYSRGSVDDGINAAEVCIRPGYATSVVHHNPMAPFATVAAWEDDRLTVYDTTQGVYWTRKVLAAWLQLPKERVRVICPFVGGAFGSGLRTNAHTVLAALAAREIGRPVKLVLTRAEMYTSVGHRPQTRHAMVLGARRDGRLTAIRHDAVQATSRFDEYVDAHTDVTQMLYACPHLSATNRLIRLDIDTPAPMRAPPQTSGVFALECAMDELAYALDLDPIELRRRNHTDRDPQSGLPWSSKSLQACYAEGAARIGWQRRNPTPRSMKEDHYLIGLGMATTTYPVHRSAASARVRLLADGTARVQSGSADIGPGTYTAMTQIAAETLDLPPERVRFELGDTELPPAPVQGGSMTVASVGSAVREACLAARAKLADRCRLDSISEDMDIAALLAKHGLDHIEAQAKAEGAVNAYSCHAFGAHFAQVRVDPDTGEIRVTRFVSAIAAGRIINPQTARSQIIGGVVGGIGQALMEHTEFDAKTGRIVNADLAGYHIPVNADVPDTEVVFIDEEDPHVNPLGTKGIGEIAIVGVAAAVANAVFHATGIRVRELPIRPEKLLIGSNSPSALGLASSAQPTP